MRRVVGAWDRFWFAPKSTATLGIVRIAYSVVLLAWAITLGPDLLSFLGSRGVVPRAPDYATAGQSGTWSLLGSNPSSAAIIAFYAVFVLAVVCLLVGFHTRIAAVAVFCGLVSFTRRNPFVLNSGDLLLRVTALYLLLSPAGSALSFDRWRKARREGDDFWDFPGRAIWPVRLMQVQISIIYFSTLWAKTGGTTWSDGSAVSYALRVGFLNRFPVPEALSDSLLLSNLLSYATLGTELALAMLVWNRRARPWVLLLGVAFHLAIDYALRVGFFSYAIFVLYLAFIPPETMDAWLWKLRDRFRRPSREPEPLSAVVEVGYPSA